MSLLNDHQDKIILAGLAIGVLLSMGILPTDTPTMGLGSNVKFVYAGLSGLGGWLFFQNYFNKTQTGFQRTVPSRSLSSPKYKEDIARQAGVLNNSPRVEVPVQSTQQTPIQPSDKMWDKFNEDSK